MINYQLKSHLDGFKIRPKIPRVSVVIPNFYGFNDLVRCLESLKKQTYSNFKIVVFDNNSSLAERQSIRSKFNTEITFIEFPQNYGFAKGYNIVLKNLTSKYVLILNNDTIVSSRTLDILINFAEKNTDVAIMQPKIISLKHPKLFDYAGGSGGFVDKLGIPYCRGRICFTQEIDSGQYNSPVEIFWAGCALFCRLKIIKRLGLFDEDLFAYVEEHDLCWRVWKAGYRIMAVPNAVVLHKGMGYWQKNLDKKIYLIHRNNLLVLVKHMRISKLIMVLPIRFFLDYLAMGYYLVTGVSSYCKSVLIAQIDFINLLPKFWRKRIPDLEKNEVWIERIMMNPWSIVFEYYIRRKKFFSQIYPNYK